MKNRVLRIIVIIYIAFFIVSLGNYGVAAESKSAASSYDAETEETRKAIVSSATDYLIFSMNDDGSFSGTYPFNVTTDVCHILETYTDTDVSKTFAWIYGQNIPDEVDPLARKSYAAGDPAMLDELQKHHNNIGGYGITKEYLPDSLDTFLMLRSVSSVGSYKSRDITKYNAEREVLISCLCSMMNGDGSFSYTKDGEGDPVLSAEILYPFTSICMPMRIL